MVGGGVAGLTAAWELDPRRVTGSPCWKPGPAVGGTVARATVGGLAVDVGAESFALAGGTVRGLVDDLGLADAVVAPAPGARLGASSRGAAPLPGRRLAGHPVPAGRADVRRVIGLPGVLRAVRGPGAARRRSGAGAADRRCWCGPGWVAGSSTGWSSRWSAGCTRRRRTELPIDRLAPRARAALAGTGPWPARRPRCVAAQPAPGAQVAGLRGGMYTLVEALVAGDPRPAGATVRPGPRWTLCTARRTGAGRSTTRGDVGLSGRRGRCWPVPAAAGSALLGRAAGAAPPTGEVLLCTLVVDLRRPGRAHRAAPGCWSPRDVPEVAAKALTHATAKWTVAGRRRRAGRHVLRLSYGRVGDAALPDRAAFPPLALADAAELLGVPLHRRRAGRTGGSTGGRSAAPPRRSPTEPDRAWSSPVAGWPAPGWPR